MLGYQVLNKNGNWHKEALKLLQVAYILLLLNLVLPVLKQSRLQVLYIFWINIKGCTCTHNRMSLCVIHRLVHLSFMHAIPIKVFC